MRKILKIYQNIRDSTLPEKEKNTVLQEIKQHYRLSIKEKAKSNFAAFCEYCIKDEDTGDYVELQDFHLEWCQLLQEESRLVLFSPIEHGKSQIISVAYPLFLLGCDPNERIAIVSNTAAQASKFLCAVKDYILRDDDIKEIFPALKPMKDAVNQNRNEKWSDYAIIVNRPQIMRDFSIQALGINGPLMSARLTRLILDDVLDQANTESDAEREKINRWHDSTAKARLLNSAQEILIGTAWRQGDLMHYLAEKPDYSTVKYSVEPTDRELGYRLASWPRRHRQEKFDKEKRHNITEYNRQRRSRTSAEESQDFADYVELAINPAAAKRIDNSFMKFTGVDLSTKKRKGTAIVDIAVSQSRKIVISVEYGAWKADQKAERIWGHFKAHNPRLVAVEDNALQDDSIDWMVAAGYSGIPFTGFTTLGPNKTAGLTTLSIEFKNGLWRIAAPHMLDDTCPCDWCRFLKEIKFYPEYPTSDGLMALFFANEAARKIIGHEPNIRTMDLSLTEEDLLLQKSKPTYTFLDYRPFNRISLAAGFKPPKGYEQIVQYIKNHAEEDIALGKDDNNLPFPLDDAMLVYSDMQRFVERLNNGVVS